MFWHKKLQGWQGSLSKLENCLSLHSFVEVSSVYCNTNLKFSHLIYAFENMLHLKLMKVRRDGSEIPVIILKNVINPMNFKNINSVVKIHMVEERV